MIKSPYNPDFGYGICHIDNANNLASVVIVENFCKGYKSKFGQIYTECDTSNWFKIRRTKKRKENFILELEEAYKNKSINNLDYVETIYNLKNG